MESFDVIIPAGGSSTRMGGDRSKLLLPLVGETTVLEKTLSTFLEFHDLSSVVIPVPKSQHDSFAAVLDRMPEGSRNVHLISGGSTRQQSVWNALQYIGKELKVKSDQKILVHDAARCFVSHDLIQRVLDALADCAAVSPGIRCTNSIKEVDESETVCRSLDRSRLRQVQTPQGFRFSHLFKAHEAALQSGGAEATDDASLVEQNERVRMIEGEEMNIKITTPFDYKLATYLLTSFR